MRLPRKIAASLAIASFLTPIAAPYAAVAAPATPIQHVIIIVGENHTFDNLFGTYQPKGQQSIDNLLSKHIVNTDGSPGFKFSLGAQNIANVQGKYKAKTNVVATYPALPQPYTTYGLGLPQGVPDTRFPANMPNGPFQISWYVPYAAYTGDPVHRFFQMWQDVDGGKMDKFAFVEQTIGTGSNGAPPPAGGFNPMEGAISLGFYNMNPFLDAHGVAQPGDAAIFKSLADNYAISDNYHQAIMGGTGANFQALVSGDAAFFTNPDGTPGVPFGNQIENPDPVKRTNNYYTQDGYSGGSYVNCADARNPGVQAVNQELQRAKVSKSNCAPN
ncbi:MAG TPA: alkaline phosphatase family protein, partial [Rhizomicrobium sp.]|nr:alkaline phosphatase family protein [Rhizomicrobium sp.]